MSSGWDDIAWERPQMMEVVSVSIWMVDMWRYTYAEIHWVAHLDMFPYPVQVYAR